MGILKQVSMMELFSLLGFDYFEMVPYDTYSVEHKNVKIRSYNHVTDKIEYCRILSVVRKDSVIPYHFYDFSEKFLFSCSSAHRVYIPRNKEYVAVADLPEGNEVVLFDGEKEVSGYFILGEEEEDILDIQVEGNHNYFTDGVLSHNTAGVGNSLKFFSSQRLDIRKTETQSAGKEEDPSFNIVRIKVIKNKVSSPFKKTELKVEFGKGYNVFYDLVQQAETYGVIQKSGSWFSYGEERLGQGATNVETMLSKNKDLYDKIMSEVKTAMSVKK